MKNRRDFFKLLGLGAGALALGIDGLLKAEPKSETVALNLDQLPSHRNGLQPYRCDRCGGMFIEPGHTHPLPWADAIPGPVDLGHSHSVGPSPHPHTRYTRLGLNWCGACQRDFFWPIPAV